MREIGNHILAVIGIFGLLSIPLVIDSCNEEEEVVAYNTSIDVDDTEVNADNFTFEVDSIRLENRADTYVEESSEELEEATSFMSEEGQETVQLTEASDEEDEVEHTEPLIVSVDSFNEAFHVARIHLGPGKEWTWDANGVTYTTFYAEEKAKYDSLQAIYWTEDELTSGTDIVEVEVIDQY
tara:strand:- start:952 stop:1497 length:546 start_codon:yes stop_codon:yes gene_type:complete